MAIQEVTFEINPNGEVSYNMSGFQGKECLEVSNVVDEALGKVLNSGDTNDMYKQKLNHQQNVFS